MKAALIEASPDLYESSSGGSNQEGYFDFLGGLGLIGIAQRRNSFSPNANEPRNFLISFYLEA
jgi:hypothetical protein